MSAKKSYADLIKEAIVALKDRTGSSTHAIKAHIAANHPSLNFAPVSILGVVMSFFLFIFWALFKYSTFSALP